MQYHIIKNPENISGQPFHVCQVARNGETLNTSETLPSLDACLKNIKSSYNGTGGTKKIKIQNYEIIDERQLKAFSTYIQNGKILKPWK